MNAPVLLTYQGELTYGSGAQPFLMWSVKARGVLAGSVGPDKIRLVTHNDVSRGNCIAATDILAEQIEALVPLKK